MGLEEEEEEEAAAWWNIKVSVRRKYLIIDIMEMDLAIDVA